MTVDLREGMAPGAQGSELFWRLWQAQEPRGAVCLLHGLGEHSGRYGPLARHLAERGISVFTFDLRGHGRSQGIRGDVDFFPRFLEDLLGMEGLMEGEVGGGIPRFLLGHSMGGLIALRRLQTLADPYAGGILSAPWLATALPEWVCRLGEAMGWVVPGLRVPSGLGGERLTRDPVMAAGWRADPLIFTRITARLFREVRRAQEEVLAAKRGLALPLLFLVPQDDQVVRSQVTEEFARSLEGDGIRVETLEGRRHEPFNDVGREAIFSLMGDWLLERLEPSTRKG